MHTTDSQILSTNAETAAPGRHVHFRLTPRRQPRARRERPRILYVTTTLRLARPYLDPSVRYRCYNPAQDLSALGCVVDVVPLPRATLNLVRQYDHVVFHRPHYGSQLLALLDYLRRANKTYAADYDDLIFDPKNALASSAYQSGRMDEAKAISVFESNLRALRQFEKVTVSTTALRDEVLISHPAANVAVIHNGLAPEWLAYLRDVRPVPPKRRSTVIGYFSGTQTHEHDFAMVEDVLVELLRKHAELELLVVGPLAFNRARFMPQQLATLDVVEYRQLPSLIQRCSLTIAPLVDNVFNQCKSGLKFFESAIFGRPVVATPIPDMQRFAGSGILLPRCEQEWTSALESLCDRAVFAETADRVTDFAQQHCFSRSQAPALFNFLTGQHA